MGIINKSNGRKSNKETQSPMLKIFKDMQKDTIDQEKITLLKDKKKDKKKKSYSESRSKSDPRSYDSSSTDRYKTNKQATITVQDILKDKDDYGFDRSRSDGVRGAVKESFWFWKDSKKKSGSKKKKNRANDDTFSFVSCALKKIIGTECTCVALLLLLVSVSVVLAFLFIFKGDTCYEMRQLIKRQLPEGYGTERIKWDRQLNSLDSASDILDNSGNNFKSSYNTSEATDKSLSPISNVFQSYKYLSDVNAELSGDLASVLDTQKIDGQTSLKLRDFFQKLVQADLKIKKLKQDMNHYYQIDNLNSFPERFKRSLKSRFSNPRSKALNERKRKNIILKKNSFKDKKRSFQNSFNVTGYIIEEEKVLVQYEPGRKRNFPKCSHSHETISHEKKLKHPFYKHSQRIDEMLKYKKPETVTNNINIMDNKQRTSKSSTNKINLMDYNTYVDEAEVMNQNIKQITKKNTDMETTFDIEFLLSTTPFYDIDLNVSTFIIPWEKRSNSKTPYISTKNRMGYRKLMEADEDDDEEDDDQINYDVKELLNDDNIESYRMDRSVKIKSRDSDGPFDPNHYNYFPSKILNRNWKGPMPFYPDEINAMIKHAAFQNFNVQPAIKKYSKSDKDKVKKDVSDTEYIEDYANDKFNRMVKMAQAYSDYGVVYNKKNEESKEKIGKPERFKQSLETDYINIKTNDNITAVTDKSGASEGLRIEYRKGSVTNRPDELIKDINKHIKFVKHKDLHTLITPSTENYVTINSNPPFSLHVNSGEFQKIAKRNKKIKIRTQKGSRSLQSIDIPDESHDNYSAEFNKTSKRNTTNIDSVFSFLAIMGDWFRTLSNLSGESNGLIASSISNNITRVNSTKSMNKRLEANNSSEILYPSYDIDMVDNIGHRSRVLMSVAENNTNDESHKYEKHIDKESSSQSEADNIVPIALILAANTTNKSKENNTSKNENMTSIVKRSIDDSKLVFWNDLYDDNEYGIKLDYGDNIREKHLVNNRGVVQKSKDWIHEKYYNLTRKAKNKTRTKSSKKTVKPKKVNAELSFIPPKPRKRNVRNSNESPEASMKRKFAALNENMKRVCQEAARAVQSSNHIEVRENDKEGSAATSLMQQLVRLMSDLVDIQVQQKTCAKLPSDLQSFLEWLTVPVDDTVRVDDLTPGLPEYEAVDDKYARYDKSTKSDFLTTLGEDSHQDDRTECLGTIRAVQDLIQQYDGMNDDDKSKMSGVKDYLKNQLNFLNNKLKGNVHTPKLYEKLELPRIKRNSPEKPKKIIKNFSKKHTRTTFNDYVTESHVDNLIITNKLAENNINNDIGVKIMEDKLTKDEKRRP